MVFQDPMVSLNPVLPIGVQLVDAIRAHMNVSRAQARQRAIDLLGHIGIPDPKNRINDYQHQFSGGMRQRVGIALALACEPKVLIADEPTTALDVTVQAQVLALLNRLREEFGMAMILITHDLGIVADVCERVNVMYSGRIVESAPVRPLFARSMMPYTEGLLASVPRIDRGREAALPAIPGSPPRPGDMEAGCRFRPRCPLRRDACEAEPHLLARGDEHLARCWATEKEGWAAR